MKKKIFKNIVITLLGGLILYYFTLPPLNLFSPAFWFFVCFLIILYSMLASLTKSDISIVNNNIEGLKISKIILIVPIIAIVVLSINFVFSPLFNAEKYSKRITIDETKSFVDDVEEVDFNAIPLLDKSSSQKLGDRTMGQMTELVSQFYVSNLYTQINYNNEIIRVTPLEYASVIKYFTNRSEGIKGYITVNSVNGESKLVKLDSGMKYMSSSLFFENLERKLRLTYPTDIFGQISFEIDNDGNPFWIVPTIKYKGIGLRKEISDLIIFDPVTGKSVKYALRDVPSWVDHVYDPELIIEQVNNWGEYRGGFWNSVFGQKNVINTTEGYNYLAMNDDIYLYTGITSVSSDESNLGFILTNMRTKDTNYYNVPGAEEFSAMASAEGMVQEKSYVASFPLLINLNNKPTYLLSLKDNAGLVKMYAFVDVVDYQKVVTSDVSLGIEAAATKYLGEMPVAEENDSEDKKTTEVQIEVKKIKTAVIDGLTHYYITDKKGNRYSASININKTLLPFLETGSKVKVTYVKEDSIRIISKIK